MARDQIDMTPLDSRDELVAWIAAGVKAPSDFRIGTEHEKTPFTLDDHRPVPYDGARGIGALLEGMKLLLGWEPIVEQGKIIGLYDVTGGGAISLEPGGQFELSGAPVETVHQTLSELMAHLSQVREVATPLGIGFLGLGMTPSWSRAEIPVMPKGRYKIMSNYMPKVGQYGLDMMFRTCTVQTNLDFSSEADMVKKLRVSVALQPVATALFANSPFTQGKPNGFLSFRSEIWRDTDNARSGMIPWAFEDGMGFERWVDYALDVPMYFVKRGDKYIDVSGTSFRDFFDGKNDRMPGEKPTLSDWANHLSTIFPEVRLKRYLEMRGSDGVPWRRLPSHPAFWVGLLYDETCLDAAWDIAKDWTTEERQQLRDDVPKLGFKAKVRDRYLFEIARECVSLAHAGLRRRNRIDHVGRDESRYLDALDQILDSGKTPAEQMLDRYHGPWNGSVLPAYDEYAFLGSHDPVSCSSSVQVGGGLIAADPKTSEQCMTSHRPHILRFCVSRDPPRCRDGLREPCLCTDGVRPPRWRLRTRAARDPRSGGLLDGLRTRPPLPRLELHLSATPQASAACWLKNTLPARVHDNCCVSGVRGAGVVEHRDGLIEMFIDRFGGDYRNFDITSGNGDDDCRAACAGDTRCRAWTYARPGYVGRDAKCFLKGEIKPPRRAPGFVSGVVR